jgi:TRAP-type C4-dicarboxylate transport system substrate-binding protein
MKGLKFIIPFFFFSLSLNADEYVLKMCAIAPEGTRWSQYGYLYKERVEKKTAGRVKVKWYLGGIMGDEPTEVRKMMLNQLQGCGFTLVGLGVIANEVKLLELPFLFEDFDEKDYVLSELTPYFKKIFEEKGFVLVGWLEVGFVRFFSMKPLKTISDLKNTRMWTWAGEELAISALSKFGLSNIIPLQLTDVLSALQTGIIDALYTPCYAGISLQWHTRMKYITDWHFSYTPAAILFTKKAIDSLPQDLRKIVLEEWNDILPQMSRDLREDEIKACEAIVEGGLIPVKFDPIDLKKLKDLSLEVHKKFVDIFYPKYLLEKTYEKREEFRAKKR